jgi:putative SOS response-associated peptidase YedK
LSGEAGKEVLVPFPADRMKASPVSSRANCPKNDDAEIIEPVENYFDARLVKYASPFSPKVP